VGPRAGLDGRKISSPPGFDPGPSSPLSVAIPTELPPPLTHTYIYRVYICLFIIHIHIIFQIFRLCSARYQISEMSLKNYIHLFIYLTTSSLAHIMPILNQQTDTVQEYEIIPFVTETSALHFSITNISEKMCEK